MRDNDGRTRNEYYPQDLSRHIYFHILQLWQNVLGSGYDITAEFIRGQQLVHEFYPIVSAYLGLRLWAKYALTEAIKRDLKRGGHINAFIHSTINYALLSYFKFQEHTYFKGERL